MSILTAPPTPDLPRLFRRAAQVINTNGLAKGGFVAPAHVPNACGEFHASDESQRPVDMVGAIRIACGQLPTESGGVEATEAIRFASLHAFGDAPRTDGFPDYIEHLADYTDLTPCTADDVIARFLRLANEAHAVSELPPLPVLPPLPPEMQAFIAAGHDPDLAHWLDCPSVYADFVAQYRSEHMAGAA